MLTAGLNRLLSWRAPVPLSRVTRWGIWIAFGGTIRKHTCIWFNATFGWIFLNTFGGRAPLSGEQGCGGWERKAAHLQTKSALRLVLFSATCQNVPTDGSGDAILVVGESQGPVRPVQLGAVISH